MSLTHFSLPDRQLAPLLESYAHVIAARRRRNLFSFAIFVACVLVGAWWVRFDPLLLWDKLGAFTSYFGRLIIFDSGGHVWTDPVEWFWGLGKWSRLLGETLLIAYTGTVLGALFAFFICFLAASNLSGRVTRWIARRILEFCRTVPTVVFALVFVLAFGLGPMAGLLALVLHTLGALGKLYTETVENIDMKPVEGLQATGGGRTQTIAYAVLPQIWSGFATNTLLRLEINFREASIMGFVGAGGIGQELLTAVRKFYYTDVSALLVMIIVTVFVLDILTSRLLRLLNRAE